MLVGIGLILLIVPVMAAFGAARRREEPAQGAMPAATARLQRYLESAVDDGTGDATDGGVLDEPATARALAGVLVRGWGVNAFEPAHVAAIGPLCTPERVVPLVGG